MNPKVCLFIFILLFVFCFLLFYSTLAPDISWAHFSNSPKILLQVYQKPLNWQQRDFFYLLFGKMYSAFFRFLFPSANPAFLLNLFSAFFSSLTIALLFLLLSSLFPKLQIPSHLPQSPKLSYLPPLFTSLLFASSFTFWSQALIASPANFYLFFFTLLLFSIHHRNKFFSFFSLLILLSAVFPLNIPKTFRTPSQFINNLGTVISLMGKNFSSPLLFLSLLGLFFSLKKSFLFLILPILIGQVFFDSFLKTSTTPPFFLPSFLILIIGMTGGIKLVLEIILALTRARMAVSFENQFFLLIFRLKKGGKFFHYLVLTISLLLVVISLEKNFKRNYPLVSLKKKSRALVFGQSAFSVLPENALVFCETEKICTTLWYFQKIVYKKAVEIQPFGKDTREQIEREIKTRPIFFALARFPTGREKGIWQGYLLESRGPLYQVLSI